MWWDEDDRDRRDRNRGSGYKRVGTSNVTTHADGTGNYLIMGVNTRRTFCKDLGEAVDHSANLIYSNNGSDEFLILKVVGRVKKKLPPVIFEEIK